MPLNRDSRLLDTTYGVKNENVVLSYDYPAEELSHGVAVVNGSATLRAANRRRRTITIYNNGGNTIFYGGTGVLTTDGMPLLPGGSVTLRMSGSVFVNSSASSDIRFTEELLAVGA